MIELLSDRKILIDLDNGIYTFGNESASGKHFYIKCYQSYALEKIL